MPEDWQNQSPDDYYRSQGLVLNSDGTEWVKPASSWVDSTPIPLQNPDASPADIAAYRVAKSVKRPIRLPVEQNAIPDAPTRPSYVMEPDLQEAQGGMQLPPGMMQDDNGRLFYADDPTTTIPMVRRPGLLPVANTPEGLKLVMPKMLDLASNVMGNVGGVMGGKVAAKAGEMVLGSGMVRKAAEEVPKVAPTFYSTLERAVSDAKPNTATKDQWLGYLRNQPGVKSEELNYTLGKLPEGQISRSQLEDIVKQNKVELGEKILGDSEHYQLQYKDTLARRLETGIKHDEFKSIDDIATAKKYNSGFRETVKGKTYKEIWDAIQEAKTLPNLDHLMQRYDTLKEANRAIKNSGAEAHFDEPKRIVTDKETKYYSYQLPGGEPGSYKEMLLKLPQSMVPNGRYVVTDGTPTFNMAANTKSEAQEILNNMQKHSNKPLSIVEDKMPDTYNNFQSSHWDEPNVLVHIRMNDRYLPTEKSTRFDELHNKRLLNDAETSEYYKLLADKERFGKKVLHIEEIQSDWAQHGRDFGFKGEYDKLVPEFNKIEEKLMATNDEKMLGKPTVSEVLKEAVDKKIINQNEANIYKRLTDIENYTHSKAVPDMPFKKNWEELALKRVIRHAAENGYDAISWEHGNAQALRYPDAMRQQINGIEWGPRAKYMEKYHSDNLKEGVTHIVVDGKEGKPWFNVDKNGNVLSASTNEAKGKHLSDVVGKDMSKQILEKREGNIDAKDFVMGAEGMKAAYDVRLPNKINEIGKKYESKVEQKDINSAGNLKIIQDDDMFVVKGNDSGNYGRFRTRKEAQTKMDQVNEISKKPIHYFPITPALRDKATKEGFPLFSSSPVLSPVTHNPFDDNRNKKYRLIPVSQPPEF